MCWIIVLSIAAGSCASADDTEPAASAVPPVSTALTRPAPTTPPSTPPSLDVALQETLDDWYGNGDTGGAVAAIGLVDGEVHIVATGEGAPGEPARPDDTMRIGSITKTFMATLTLRLDDQDLLDIDQPVASYLPDLGIDETVIVRDLLAHTSGITDPDPEELIALFRADSGERFEYQDLMAFANIPTNADHRSDEFVYANTGYHVLGGVIEAATGTDIASAVRTYVTGPAGLTDTYLAGAERVPAPIVPGNVDLDGDGREDSLADVPYLAVETAMWSAGALVSTGDDLITFARALFAGTIISDRALTEMTTTNSTEDGHGLGIFDLGIDGATVYGNSGGAPGFHANFAHDPSRGITAVVFTNCLSCAVGSDDTWQLVVDFLAIADTNTT
jgi:D-alanyl-D-alanine carboxypeptidase